MVWPRFRLLILGAWILDLFLFLFLPALRVVVDPFFLLLVLLGFWHPSGRFIWVWGLGLGLLKDLVSGTFWGGSALVFGAVGLLLVTNRHLVEREDPLLIGIWTGIAAALKEILYGFLLVFLDPFVRFTGGWWGILILSSAANGVASAWSFPILTPFLRRNSSSTWLRVMRS